MGDINIDSKKRDNNMRLYGDFLKRNNLINMISSNTCFDRNEVRLSAVDHFVTSAPDLYIQHGIVPFHVSDHYIVFGTRKKFKCKHDKVPVVARSYSKYDPAILSRDLENQNWEEVLQCNHPDQAWEVFVEIFTGLLDIHAPWKSMSAYLDSPPWVTHEFISECKNRDFYEVYANRTKNPAHARELKRIRNRVNLIKNNMKKVYFRNAIETAKNDSGKLWKVIKELLRQGKSKVRIKELNGKSSNEDIANELVQYFTDIGPNLAADIPNSLLNQDFTPNPEILPFELQHTTVEEVKKLLIAISAAKATGCDGIPVKFLKCNLDVSSKILCHIINLSITTKIVPSGWKVAEVVPLFKSGDMSKPENYRLISILPSASKLLEKVVHKQLYAFLQRHSLFSNAQFGFRKGHSTSSCILHLTDVIYRNMDSSLFTGVVFLDLKKAFDTVDHSILLKKLYKYSISVESITWFESYLTGRKQLIKVNGVKSSLRDVLCGVPQGSILGPLLFILYINDLFEYLTDTRINLYADDTALYYADSVQDSLMSTLSSEMHVVGEWLRANKLTLNIAKTKFVIFGTAAKLRNLQDIPLKLYGETIEKLDSMKYLGVFLDSNLSFDRHIDYIVDKAAKKIGVIRKVNECLYRSTALTLYKSLVLPLFDYCDTVYMCTSMGNLSKLQLLQNQACRTILLAGIYMSVIDMHRSLKLELLNDRRNVHMALECHKNIYFEDQSSLAHFYVPVIDIQGGIRTRHSESKFMSVPRTRTAVGGKAYSVRGPNFWNSIVKEFRLIETFSEFKTSISSSALVMFENHPT